MTAENCHTGGSLRAHLNTEFFGFLGCVLEIILGSKTPAVAVATPHAWLSAEAKADSDAMVPEDSVYNKQTPQISAVGMAVGGRVNGGVQVVLGLQLVE